MEKISMAAPREAALSSFAAPSTGNRSKSKESHVRVVCRIRPMNEQEKHGVAAIQPIQEAPASPKQQWKQSSPPRPTPRKGPFKFLTPKKKRPKQGSHTPQRTSDQDATPVIRNGQRPPTTSSIVQEPYGTAKSLSAQDRIFDFDAVFGQDATQKEVYDRSVGDAVRRNIFRGYNTTIIAYGQTASGKTYTMGGKRESEMCNRLDAGVSPTSASNSARGSFANTPKSGSTKSLNSVTSSMDEESTFAVDKDDGIIPRAVHDLFKAKQRHESAGEVTIALTYLEIYNDELRDLLVDGGDDPMNMKLIDQGDDGIVVKGLTTVTVKSTEQVKQLMEEAAKRRTTTSTKMNMRSSRSHAICSLMVTINPATQQQVASSSSSTLSSNSSMGSTRAEVITAKLTLVDLAGSERLKQTGVVGLHQQESIAINQDLFVLGKVISSLAEKSKTSKVHVPYRDSKLTRLLRDSLGGNCCTVMVACVSPPLKNLDESINTLRYAERARSITNAVKQNVIKAVMTPAECAALRGENKALKLKVQQLVKQVSLLKEKTDDADTLSADTNFTADDLSLGASTIGERVSSSKTESTTTQSTSKSDSTTSDAQLDAKNLALMSLDLEINEKKEIVEKLRAETAELEAKFATAEKAGVIAVTSMNRSVAHQEVPPPHPLASAAPGTKIEMVALSNTSTSKDEMEKLARQHARVVRILEEKVHSLIQVNGGLRQELNSQRQQIESQQDEVKDDREKVEALVLQLEFEQKRIIEHESTLRQTQQDLRDTVEERDGYRMKLAVQLDEIAKRDDEISALKKQVEEMGKLRFALSFSEQQVEELRRTIREMENEGPGKSLSTPNKVGAGVLMARDTNVGSVSQNNEKKEPQKSVEMKNRLPDDGDDISSIHSDPVAHHDGDTSFDTNGSEDSDHRAIRLQAAKMLFFANKAIERGRDSRSVCSSLASSNGSEFKPEMSKIRSMINESSKIQRSSSMPPVPAGGKPPTPRVGMLPPRPGSSKRSPTKAPRTEEEEEGPVISNLHQIVSMNDCLCSKDPEYVDFFLPKLGASCSCGQNDPKDVSMSEADDPLALPNILRDWQVDFLHSCDINTAVELITVYNIKGGLLAKEMRKWRKKKGLKSVKTSSCGVALHIWARTCKAVIKSVQQQLADGAKIVKRPAILEVAWTSDNNTAVSSLGSSLAEF